MRIKILIVTILALIGFALYFVSECQQRPAPVNNAEQLYTNINENNDALKPINPTDKSDTVTIKEEITPENIEFMANEAVFDPDPVVDANMILKENRMCILQLTSAGNTNQYLEQLQHRFSKQQFDYYKNLKNHCKQLNIDHPEYYLTNSNKLYKQFKENQATSLWGKVLKQEIDVESLSHYEIEDLLKENSLAILSEAPKHLEKYYQEVIHWDLEGVLQNHQYDYTRLIRHYSHQLYLCTLGADCSGNSSIMTVLCINDSKSCGLTFTQYTTEILTQGQQADIALAMQYLQTKYN